MCVMKNEHFLKKVSWGPMLVTKNCLVVIVVVMMMVMIRMVMMVVMMIVRIMTMIVMIMVMMIVMRVTFAARALVCNMLESRIFTRSKVFVVQPRRGTFSRCKAYAEVRQFDRVHQFLPLLRLEVFEEQDDQRDDSKHDDGRREDGEAVEHLVLAQRVGVHVERPEGWQLDVSVFLR